MPKLKTRKIVLASRPIGEPTEDNFRLIEEGIADQPERGLLLKTLFLSLDPYMRGLMDEGASYTPGLAIGGVMDGGAVSQVLSSKLNGFSEGDIVIGYTGWQEYTLSDGTGLRKVDPAIAPISTSLGILGMPGMTAYTGLLNIGQPKPGETLVVAAASGAVGSVVGQIAKLKGCRVVGIAGGPEKVDYLTDELGFRRRSRSQSAGIRRSPGRSMPAGRRYLLRECWRQGLECGLSVVEQFCPRSGLRTDRALQRYRPAARS